MSDLDSESEVNGIIRNLRSELAAATEIGYRWMGNYKDKEKECAELRKERDAAYLERNQVVAALSKCFPSVVTKTAIEGWSPEWHNCVYIDLPTGQASWHFHDSHAHLFKDLLVGGCVWDGHTMEQKYERLAALKPNGALLGEKS